MAWLWCPNALNKPSDVIDKPSDVIDKTFHFPIAQIIISMPLQAPP